MAENKSNRGQVPPPPIPPMNVPQDAKGEVLREQSGHEDRSVPFEDRAGSPDGATSKAAKALGFGGPKEIDPEDDDGVTPLGPDQGIRVKATREGVFRCQRMTTGDFFNIPNMTAWGDWMALADDEEEAARQKKEAAKKREDAAKAKEEAAK